MYLCVQPLELAIQLRYWTRYQFGITDKEKKARGIFAAIGNMHGEPVTPSKQYRMITRWWWDKMVTDAYAVEAQA